MGNDPKDGAGPEYFSTQGRATSHQEASEETGGWDLVILLIGGGNGRSRLQRDQDIHHEEAEYGCAVYCDTTDSVPM